MLKLNILLVEDNQEDLDQFVRDLPRIFLEKDIESNLDAKGSFEEGIESINNPHIRYDMVISDTYRGEHKNRDAAVHEIVKIYRSGKFCPLIVCSSGECPADLEQTPFVRWADKATPDCLEKVITEVLDLGIPQTARGIYDDLEKAAGQFLWGFLEKNWTALNDQTDINKDKELLDRLIRRRAAMIISDLAPGKYTSVDSRYGLEYYIYPPLKHDYYSLGNLIRNNSSGEIRVILTPHCYLYQQPGQHSPRADYILTIKTVPVTEVFSKEKLNNAKEKIKNGELKTLKNWVKSPAQTGGKPEGRHWYLPKFLDIPHLYCDFFQVESLEYEKIKADYTTIATLHSPYAEALQECFSSFYSSVGVSEIKPTSITDFAD